MQILKLILNFKGHVYVPELICIRFNDIHVLFIIDCIIFVYVFI